MKRLVLSTVLTLFAAVCWAQSQPSPNELPSPGTLSPQAPSNSPSPAPQNAAPAGPAAKQPAMGSSAPQHYVVIRYSVRPAAMDDYVGAVSSLAQWLKANNYTGPEYQWMSFVVGTDVYAVTPVADWAGIDRFQQAWAAVGKNAQAKLILQRISLLVDHASLEVMRDWQELSYHPAQAVNEGPGNDFCRLTAYHATPGSHEELTDIGRRIRALNEEKKVPHAFRVFTVESGSGLPAFLVLTCATNELELMQADAEDDSLIGDAWKPIEQELTRYLRHYQSLQGHWSAILSNSPLFPTAEPQH
jgi:hypothetical protein